MVVTLVVMVAAVLAVFNTAVERTPSVTLPVVMVAVPYPGAQPDEVERDISRKIEDQLAQLDEVDYITSTSMRGSGVTQIVFQDHVAIDQARTDVQNLIDQIRRELPQARDVEPIVTDISFDDLPMILINITGEMGPRKLKEIAEDVSKELEIIPGVAEAEVFGGLEREIHVNVDADLLMQYGLTLDDIRQVLQESNTSLPAGSLSDKTYVLQVRSETRFKTPADIAAVVIANRNGRLVHIRDVAKVKDTHRRVKSISQLNGIRCVTLVVRKKAQINMLDTLEMIKRRIAELEVRYPGLEIQATRDVGDEIRIMFETIGSSALYGGVMVLVLLRVLMGFRSAALVTIALPVTAAITLVFLYVSGNAVNNMVIFSSILVMGMVVDGAIIVVENIYRHIELGEDPVQAAKQGIAEVGIPVIAADLTTIAAFLPMLMVSGITGEFMAVLPKVVTVALFGSVLVDHFLLPVACSRFFSRRSAAHGEPVLYKAEKNSSTEGHDDVAQEKERISNVGGIRFLQTFYVRLLKSAIAHQWITVLLTVYALSLAVVMLATGRIPFTFFPESDRGQFDIFFELPIGYSIDQTEAVATRIAEPLNALFEKGEMLSFVTTIGTTGGISNRLDNDPAVGPEFGRTLVELVQPNQRERSLNEILEEVRQQLPIIPGAEIRIEKVTEGPPSGSPVAIRLQGDDLVTLGEWSNRVADQLRSIDGTRDVKSDYRPDSPEIVVDPVPSLCGLQGITEGDIARTVQTAILGDTTVRMDLDDEEINVRLQLKPSQQRSIENIKDLLLRGTAGRVSTLDEVAQVRLDTGLYNISRRDRRRAVTVRCNVDSSRGFTPDDIFSAMRPAMAEMGFSAVNEDDNQFTWREITAHFTGENEDRDEGFQDLLQSMTFAVCAIAAILTIQFNSFRLMLVVMVTVPLSFVGVVLGLWIMDFHFSLPAFIGLVCLTGIVVNDAIVMISYTNELRASGKRVREALVIAGQTRFRPVLLTTLTTTGGLLPLFLNISGGNEFWQPLTGSIIFGLCFATVLTLVVIPVFYSLVYRD